MLAHVAMMAHLLLTHVYCVCLRVLWHEVHVLPLVGRVYICDLLMQELPDTRRPICTQN